MTQETDVAALIAELNEWAGSYEEGSFDTEEDLMRRAAAELTRLAAERDTYLSNWKDARAYLVVETHHAEDAEAERDIAKAELTRLAAENAKLDHMAKEGAALFLEAQAEIARLTEENADLKEFDRTKPDAEWREMYEDISKSAGYQRGRADRAEAELSEAKATIERLRAVLAPDLRGGEEDHHE